MGDSWADRTCPTCGVPDGKHAAWMHEAVAGGAGGLYMGVRAGTGERPSGMMNSAVVLVVDLDLDVAPRFLPHHVRHSPTGFEWGYAGSGPADLARCILIDALGDAARCSGCDGTGRCAHKVWEGDEPGEAYCLNCGEPRGTKAARMCMECWGGGYGPQVERAYQDFKFLVVAGLPHGGWLLTRAAVLAWVRTRTQEVVNVKA